MTDSLSPLHYFGIRHHGPGCARSLLTALEHLQPDCILIEGPPDAQALLPFVTHADLTPPVALLIHGTDDTEAAAFYPFADFSPEWQALRYGIQNAIPTRFMDLPQSIRLAQRQEKTEPEPESQSEPQPESATLQLGYHDPLDALAHAAGFADGESWWNRMVEERGNGENLFAAIHEAMAALRETESTESNAEKPHSPFEAQREAYMRQSIREAVSEKYQRIAVICGAWHVPALQAKHTAKADTALLKGLPKLKVSATWIPWTYQRLTHASGYGAGIDAPGWYEHLWNNGNSGHNNTERSHGWLARIARLLRERDMDCSSAHIIEAVRLAQTLAAMRERSEPGLEELDEAVRTVFSMGDAAPLDWIHHALTVGERMGHVPADVPTVPLQRDIEKTQKTLRLKPSALAQMLELDLRNATDLARSHFLHRLRLLGIAWGTPQHNRTNRGTFRETWNLQWKPELALHIIEATRLGATVELAANAHVAEQCQTLTRLDALAELIDTVLLADLRQSIHRVSQALQTQAALTGDAVQLMASIPPLARVFRYGSVRQMDSDSLTPILDGLITRAAISLPLACQSIDDTAAHGLRETLLNAHQGIALRDAAEPSQAWQTALRQTATGTAAHALLRGLSCRLLLDGSHFTQNDAATELSRNLSSGAAPLEAAQWLDGFLNRNATVLLHDAVVWQLVDEWLASLVEEHFLQIVPLLRRSFANFSQSERRDLGQQAARETHSTPPVSTASPSIDPERAAWPLPTLRLLWGLDSVDSADSLQ